MAPAVAELYAPLIERELDAIPSAARRFAAEHGLNELFLAVARFAVLAFVPSQHSKHALLAALAAHDVRKAAGDRWIDLLVECAKYASQSRQPWSEPPILEPPAVEASQPREIDELRAAVANRDRLRGERWLAARIDDDDVVRDLLSVASEDLEDLGHKVIVTAAVSRLLSVLGEKGRYALLRVAVSEIVAYSGTAASGAASMPIAACLHRAVDRCLAEQGSLTSAHDVFLLDAAIESGEPSVIDRVTAHISRSLGDSREVTSAHEQGQPGSFVYPLARDYAQLLKAHAVAERLRPRFASVPWTAFLDACRYNLDNAPSFEEWSFA